MSPKWNGTFDTNESEAAPRFSDLQESQHMIGQSCETYAHKDRFIALVSHELRNMVAPVVIALDACNLSRANEASPELLKLASERVRKLSQLIDELFDAARIAAGKIKLQVESIDLRAIAKKTVRAVIPSMKACGHEFLLTQCDSPLWLTGDPLRL